MLSAGNFPRHRTICEFRRRHLKDFEGLFAQVVGIAREMGIAKLGALAIDGSKVKANASRRKAMSYGRMLSEEKRLRREIAALLERAEAIDRAEDEEYGPENRGDELPEELLRRSDRIKAIAAARERLEAKQRQRDKDRGRGPGQGCKSRRGRPHKRAYGEPDPRAQSNFTDPESSIMKTSTEGFQQAYNAQTAVDSESRLIVAVDVTASPADTNELLGMLEQAEKNVGQSPSVLLADAGYASEHNLAELEARGIEGYVSLGREGRQSPAQQTPARRRMATRLSTDDGRRAYAARKHIAEPPFGWIKQVMGFRRFSVRGLEKVRGEWALVCLALNARRLNVPLA